MCSMLICIEYVRTFIASILGRSLPSWQHHNAHEQCRADQHSSSAAGAAVYRELQLICCIQGSYYIDSVLIQGPNLRLLLQLAPWFPYFCSNTLSLEHFQLLEQAAAVLSALRAQQIPVALVIPDGAQQILHSCLEQANLLEQFKVVVRSSCRGLSVILAGQYAAAHCCYYCCCCFVRVCVSNRTEMHQAWRCRCCMRQRHQAAVRLGNATSA